MMVIVFVKAPREPNNQILEMINESEKLARVFCDQKWPVLAFLDTHQPGKLEHPYPSHCLAGSHESKLVPGIIISSSPSSYHIQNDLLVYMHVCGEVCELDMRMDHF